jgi:hypothetical protein
MSAITARFHVSEMTRRPNGNATLVLTPAYANGANAAWATATPSGRIELQVNNPAAIEEFAHWLETNNDIHITMEPLPKEQ